MIKKILVIDDDEGILEGFTAILESEKYTVITSRNPLNVERLATKELPDLILLDILLSGHDGRTICKLLKHSKVTKDIPIIMMSAALNMSESVKKAGADGFLKKPFEMDELLATVSKYIETSHS